MLIESLALSQDAFSLLHQALGPLPFAGKHLESDWAPAEVAGLTEQLGRLVAACPAISRDWSWIPLRLAGLADGSLYRHSQTGGGGWNGNGSHPWRFNMDVNQLSAGCVDLYLANHGRPPHPESGTIDLPASADQIFSMVCRLRFSRPVLNTPVASLAAHPATTPMPHLLAFGGNYVTSNRYVVFHGFPPDSWPEVGPAERASTAIVAAAIYDNPDSIYLFGPDMAARRAGDPTFQTTVATANRHADRLADDLARCRADRTVLVTRTRDNGDYE